MNDLALFELKTDISIGTITTNAALLLDAVKQEVEKYHSPDYIPTEQVAKKDRASLNRAEKKVAEKAKEIRDLWNAPLDEFNEIVVETRKTIKEASGVIDTAVKDYEAKEKEKKREDIQTYFSGKKFDLVPLERLFDEKWLNKGTKINEIKEQIDEKISAIYRDIEILERIPEHEQTAKAIYLEKLDLGAALRQVDILKENAERLAREQANREERKVQEQVMANAESERQEIKEAIKEGKIQSLVDDALDIEPEYTGTSQSKIITVDLRLMGEKDALFRVKQSMTANNVSYVKL